MNRNPNPGCEQGCRFAFGPEMVTALHYTPIYDKHGNNLNPDRNTGYGNVSCYTCNKIWHYTRKYDEPTTYIEGVR